MANSINTNISAYFAQANITAAANLASSSVARLSSGNRIVQAADDVAALSIGTGLRTGVATLRVALTNASQGTSLLQVADGSLAQVSEILQRQKAIAVQAASGSLDDTARSYLNAEFQSLSEQINSLTRSTNFNGVKLINGSLSDSVKAVTNTSNAAAGDLVVNFTKANPAVGDTFIINGVTLTLAITSTTAAAGNVVVGASIANREAAVAAIAAYINNAQNDNSTSALSAANKLLLSGLKATADGSNLIIQSRAGGVLGQKAFVDYTTAGTTNGSFTNTSSSSGAEQTKTFSIGSGITSIDGDAVTDVTGNDFAAGALTLNGATLYTIVAGDSLRKIAAGINANAAATGVSAYITGTSGAYSLVLKTTASQTGTIGGAGAGDFVSGGAENGITTASTLITTQSGAGRTGLQQGGVIGVGSTGDSTSLVTTQSQSVRASRITFTEPTTLTSLASQTVTIGGQAFTFSTNSRSATSSTEVAVGTSLAETLDNLVEKINGFRGTTKNNYEYDQIEAVREGNDLVIRTRQASNFATIINASTGIAIAVSGSNISSPTNVSAGVMTTGSNTGIDASAVTNSAFAGVIQGFAATYAGAANRANITVVVGGITYSALNVNTQPTADGEIQFQSETGGSFLVKLRGGQGRTVTDAASATDYARALDASFAGVTFYQKRDISSYNATGNLVGSSFRFQGSSFTNLSVDNITVNAPAGSNPNAVATFTINGETYSATALGTQLGANSLTRFISATDPNKFIEFRNGANVLNLSNSASAATLQAAFRTAFGVGTGQASLSFQVGVTADDSLSVSIGNASTSALFNGLSLSVDTQSNANAASSALDAAINTVTALRANVGALQSRFNYASAAIQVSVQNQDAARGALLDTDIAVESTNFATYQVKLQAGISVLAQANQQLQNLLKLIQ